MECAPRVPQSEDSDVETQDGSRPSSVACSDTDFSTSSQIRDKLGEVRLLDLIDEELLVGFAV